MSDVLKGFVLVVNTKSGRGARGPWTLYSTKLEDENGNEGPWVSLGFEDPGIKKDDYVTIEFTRDDKGRVNAVKGGVNKPKNPPARAGARVSGGEVRDQASGNNAGNGGTDGSDGETGANKQTQIVMQHSQEMAIRLVSVLLANEALPMSGAKTKAAEAKRFEEITAAVDKLTVQLYNDVVTGRLLDVVADAGADRVSTKSDGPIPAADEPRESYDE